MRKRILAVTLALMLAMLAGSAGLAACSQGAGSESGQAASDSSASASRAAGNELDDDSSQAGASPAAGATSAESGTAQGGASPTASAEQSTGSTATLEVNGQTLQVALEANDAGRAFADLMADGPVTVDAHEFGGFEQVGDLPQPFPASDTQITTEPGDIVLYQGDQVSVFYGSNTWSYTRLGHIEGQTADQLEALLGAGDAQLVFSLA